MKNDCKKYTNSDKIYITTIKEHLQMLEIIEQKLKIIFNFNIPKYVIDDIVREEGYTHFCLMVNICVINRRMSKDNASFLKDKIKNILNVFKNTILGTIIFNII